MSERLVKEYLDLYETCKDHPNEQDGVLNQADVSLLIGVSAGIIGKDIREFQLERGVILPYRGTIHDIGPTLTHKKIIIQQFVRNVPTPEIARRTSHSEVYQGL